MYDDDYLNETLRRAFEDEEHFNVPKGIMRYDYQVTHGWWVRVTREGVQFKEFFNDHKYESSEAALRAAILARHKLLAEFPILAKRLAPRSLPPEPEKRINRVTHKGKSQPYLAWRGRWYDREHKIQSKSFSVREYGEETAKKLALEAAAKNHNSKPKIIPVPDPYSEQHFKPLSRADVAILSTIDSKRERSEPSPSEVIEGDPHAFEGERRFEIHLAIERNRQLREQKITQFLTENSRLFCELCGFSFASTYQFLAKDIIEVHHIVPLSQLSKATETRLSDLMLLCSNCHFAIHQGDAEENLLKAWEQFDGPGGSESKDGEKR